MSQNRRNFLSTAFLTAGALGLGGKVLANDADKYDCLNQLRTYRQ
jgi:hypothetical protein